jgi:hypothetical protein
VLRLLHFLNLKRIQSMKLVEFLRARAFEEPFLMHGEKWQFVTIRRADGAEDIGVYRFSTDLCHDYVDFRAHFNLS